MRTDWVSDFWTGTSFPWGFDCLTQNYLIWEIMINVNTISRDRKDEGWCAEPERKVYHYPGYSSWKTTRVLVG